MRGATAVFDLLVMSFSGSLTSLKGGARYLLAKPQESHFLEHPEIGINFGFHGACSYVDTQSHLYGIKFSPPAVSPHAPPLLPLSLSPLLFRFE